MERDVSGEDSSEIMANQDNLDDILRYYQRTPEEPRLFKSSGILEFTRSKEIIMRYLAPPPLMVLDVGGGPGAYACWMAQQGYEVHLIDPVPRHLSLAREASRQQPESPIASVNLGDARRLDWHDESCDAVLLMGPLYHLTEADERQTALLEARRVLRPGGMVIGVGINKFAGIFNGLVNGYIDDPDFRQILERDLAEGQHRNSTSKDYFTTAYFHRPEEMESEISEAGFTVLDNVAVQGPGWLANGLEERMSDPEARERLLGLVRKLEREPSLAGVSQHFMVIGRK